MKNTSRSLVISLYSILLFSCGGNSSDSQGDLNNVVYTGTYERIDLKKVAKKTYRNGDATLQFTATGNFDFILPLAVRYHSDEFSQTHANCKIRIAGNSTQANYYLTLNLKEVEVLESALPQRKDLANVPHEVICREFAKRLKNESHTFKVNSSNASYMEINPRDLEINVKNKNPNPHYYEFDSEILLRSSWAHLDHQGRTFFFADNSEIDLTEDFINHHNGHFANETLSMVLHKDLRIIVLQLNKCKEKVVVSDFSLKASLSSMLLTLTTDKDLKQLGCIDEASQQLVTRFFEPIETSYHQSWVNSKSAGTITFHSLFEDNDSFKLIQKLK